jgi:mannose-1-phosphate guanylyltransferase
VSLLVAPERTVVVTQQRHARYIAPDLQGRRVPWVLPQPESRGTAAAVLLPAHLISWRDPEAIVAVFPSDHFVPDARAFMDHVARIVTFVGHHREWLLLLGARPAEAETEYGWIEPGPAIGDIAGEPAWRVRRFWEKPSPELARLAFASGCLWNTFVFVASAATLLEESRRALPELCERLSHIAPFAGTEDESWAIRQAYALAPTANFSKTLLASVPSSLGVARLPTLTWSDWGTPSRVLRSLDRAGISPPWLDALPAGMFCA